MIALDPGTDICFTSYDRMKHTEQRMAGAAWTGHGSPMICQDV